MIITSEQEDKIVEILDKGTWKHSWHVRRTKGGYIDFEDTKNLDHMLDIARRELDNAIDTIVKAREAISILESKKTSVLDNMLCPHHIEWEECPDCCH